MTGHGAVNGVTTVPTTVPALLALRVAEDPAAIALVADGQGELSYGEWLRQARATASSLENAGLGHANGLVQMSGGLAALVVPVVAVAALSWFGIAGILVLDADDLVGLAALRGSDQSPPVEPGR